MPQLNSPVPFSPYGHLPYGFYCEQQHHLIACPNNNDVRDSSQTATYPQMLAENPKQWKNEWMEKLIKYDEDNR